MYVISIEFYIFHETLSSYEKIIWFSCFSQVPLYIFRLIAAIQLFMHSSF